MAEFTKNDLKAGQDVCEKATPEPWEARCRDSSHKLDSARWSGLGWEIDGPPEPMLRGQFERGEDAIFVAHARTYYPLALVALAEARTENIRLQLECEQETIRCDMLADKIGYADLERRLEETNQRTVRLKRVIGLVLKYWWDKVYPSTIFIGGRSSDSGTNRVARLRKLMRGILDES